MKYIFITVLFLVSISAFSQTKKADTVITQKIRITLDVQKFNELIYRLSTSGVYTGAEILQYEEALKPYIKQVSDTTIKKR